MVSATSVTAEKQSRNLEEVQVNYILRTFPVAVSMKVNDRSMVPLAIKMYRLEEDTYKQIIELHGSFSREIAEKAINCLKEKGELEDFLPELVIDKKGFIIALRFTRPVLKKCIDD